MERRLPRTAAEVRVASGPADWPRWTILRYRNGEVREEPGALGQEAVLRGAAGVAEDVDALAVQSPTRAHPAPRTTLSQPSLTSCQQLRGGAFVEARTYVSLVSERHRHDYVRAGSTTRGSRLRGEPGESLAIRPVRTLGFGLEQACLLVSSDADLHLTRSLVAAGCSLDLALEIVT